MSLMAERRRRGLTAEQVARHLGIGRASLGEIENGKIPVTPDYVADIVVAMIEVEAEAGAHPGGG